MMPQPFRLLGSLLACLVFGSVGCSSGTPAPPTVNVTGEVLYQSKPVEGAYVTFASKSAEVKSASGTTDASGKFTLKTYVDPTKEVTGAMPGDYQVSISKIEKKAPMTPEEMSKISQSGQMIPPPKSLIPQKYSEITSSGLNASVKQGDSNNFKFELMD